MNPKIQAQERLISFDLKTKLKLLSNGSSIYLKEWLIDFYLKGWKDCEILHKPTKNTFKIT